MHRSLLSAALLALLFAACTPAEGPQKPVNIAPPPPPASTDTHGATLVSVFPRKAPQSVTVDGDLTEWGALPAPPDTDKRPPTLDENIAFNDEGTESPIPDPPENPADAASKVLVAFSADGAYLAGDLGDAAKEGVWIGLGTLPAELPLLGQYFGRMGFQTLNCKTKPMVSDDDGGGQGYWMEDRTPEEVEACKSIKARSREMTQKHEARFEKLYRVDSTGVRVAGPGGALTAIEGAKSVWKTGPHGATFEVSLPGKALPRVAEAHLAKVRVLTDIHSAPPTGAPDQWRWFTLGSPVGFEPFAALRKLAFERANDVGDFNAPGTTTYKLPRGLSFQPGDPTHLEIVSSNIDRPGEAREIPLYQTITSFQDVEIVSVAAPRGMSYDVEMEPWIATLKKGQVKEIIRLKGPPAGKMQRGDEIHLLSFDSHVWEATPGEWSVLGFNPSGDKRDVPVEAVPGYDPFHGKPNDGPAVYWEETKEFVSDDHETFGWRGIRGGKGFEAVWKWDPASKGYKADQHRPISRSPRQSRHQSPRRNPRRRPQRRSKPAPRAGTIAGRRASMLSIN